MNELTTSLKVALANAYIMYFKAHAYHWNVEGPNFSDYHAYFATVYEDVYGSIDEIAENIRKCGDYAPFSLYNLFSFKTSLEDSVMPTNYTEMFNNLILANNEVIAALKHVNDVATRFGEVGLANYTAERIDTHMMHQWQLKSLAKTTGV